MLVILGIIAVVLVVELLCESDRSRKRQREASYLARALPTESAREHERT